MGEIGPKLAPFQEAQQPGSQRAGRVAARGLGLHILSQWRGTNAGMQRGVAVLEEGKRAESDRAGSVVEHCISER
jgi:hypothetical protein